jgi:hypothetical protein
MKDGLIIVNVLAVSMAILFAYIGIEASEAPGTMAGTVSNVFYIMAGLNAVSATFVNWMAIKSR